MTEAEQRQLQLQARQKFSQKTSYFDAQLHGVIHKKQPLTDQDIEQLTAFLQAEGQDLKNLVFFGNTTVKNCTTERKILNIQTKKWRSYKY